MVSISRRLPKIECSSSTESNGIVTHTDDFCKRWFAVGSFWTFFVYASMHCTYLLHSDGHVLNDTWLGHHRAYLAACIRLLRTQPKAFLGTLGSLGDCLLRDICGAFHSSQADHSYVLPEFVSYPTLIFCLVSATSQFEPTLKLCVAVFPNWLVRHLPTEDEICPKFRYF